MNRLKLSRNSTLSAVVAVNARPAYIFLKIVGVFFIIYTLFASLMITLPYVLLLAVHLVYRDNSAEIRRAIHIIHISVTCNLITFSPLPCF